MNKLYFPTKDEAQKASRRFAKGKLYRIRNGIYIATHDTDEIAKALENQWMELACHLFDSPVAIARTAAELRPAEGRLYFASSVLKKQRTVEVGHLKLTVSPGNTDQGVEQVGMEMRRSIPARYYLENLAFSRGNKNSRKTLGDRWVESELVRTIHRGGENAINVLRDEARTLASILDLDVEFEKLNTMIAALLKTHPIAGILKTSSGIAAAKGDPFDEVRLNMFKQLGEYMQALKLSENDYEFDQAGWRNLTFFESYFSNYIEGTEFTIAEAEEIAFEKKVDAERHQDSHDILAHIEIAGDMVEMYRAPATASELIELIKARHSILMAERPEKSPGKFKTKSNKAGGTHFVLPEFVEGTLRHGFDFYEGLPAGMKRAIFVHFLISECHPFDDGNGRVSRIMMNAELVSQEKYKLIMPSVHRESYLGGLRAASRQRRFRPMVKELHQMQCYTAALDWRDYGQVKMSLQQHAADKDADEGVAVFNKVISKFGQNYPAG